jgi:hypothetical protein
MDLSGVSVAELNSELIRRTGGEAALDRLFTLPEWIENTTLREAYEVIVARMRRESGRVPMNTIQQLLIERIAFNYIVLRVRETFPLGDDQGFAHAGVVKEFNTFWLSMTREFNDLLVKFRPAEKDAVMALVKQAFEECIAAVDWTGATAQRNDLVVRLPDTFKRYALLDS